MDPSSISSPAPPPNTVPFAVEPNNHPPPQPLPSPSANHPPYAEMIYTAIEALKEKDGSSKRAISKYIEQVYKDQLPNSESHQSLLTHHLKRLKSEGLLQMIKNSYIIPRSGPLPPSPPPTASPSPSSRPRGRPRKVQTPVAQAHTPQAQDNVINPPPQPFPVVVSSNNYNNNSSSPVAAAQTQAQQNASAEPVWAALGLTDEPAVVQAGGVIEGSKRRPGRPKKGLGSSPSPSQGGSQQLSPTPSRGRGRPPGSKSKSKKRPGRPPKIQPETPGSATATTAAGVGDVSGGSKRRRGRPAKDQQQNPTVIPFAAPVPEVVVPVAEGGVAVLTPRSRGRPRKNANAVAAVPVAVVAAATGRGRGRGRGRGGVAGRGRGGGRGRGRPRINLLARPAGRPVGRPKKGTSPATASAPENAAKEEDLRRKLEHFQVKVKESLAVLRPHFNHESPVTAIAAIQELDILVAMDLNEPLKDDTPPQQQNLPAQDQPQPQQQQQPPQQPSQQLLPQHLPPHQIVAQPQMFPQYPPFQTQEYHFQLPPQLYQQPPPPPQQNQFHP